MFMAFGSSIEQMKDFSCHVTLTTPRM
jgi:hypothetical protein